MDKHQIEEKLEKKLEELKLRFNTGVELKLIYIPNGKRINKSSNRLLGEIQGDNILIYDTVNPIDTLVHEFVEFVINTISEDYLLIINSQNKIIEKLLYSKREGVVDKLTNGLS